MTKRILPFIFFLTCILLPALASTSVNKDVRKQMKAIHEQIKSNKGAEAFKSVQELRRDSNNAHNVQLLQYGVDACKITVEKENEKFYLKSKPDTAALFNSLYNLVDYILLTDSAERMNTQRFDGKEEKGIATKYRYRKQNQQLIDKYCKNFLSASRYFTAQGKWNETKKFTSLTMELASSSILYNYKRLLIDSSAVADLAVLHTNACYKLQDYAAIEKYGTIALRDSATREGTIEKLAAAGIQRGDSIRYFEYLKQGHALYPANMFFFSRLVDVFLKQGDNGAVLSTANSTLEYVLSKAQHKAQLCVIDTTGNYDKPSDAQALNGVRENVALPDNYIAQIFEARAIAFHNNKNARQCIIEAENILSWNAQHPRAEFYIGASYYNMAESIKVPERVTDPEYQRATNERNRFLSLSKPHLEKYRSQAPQASNIWAPLLYEIYLYLNLGQEFEEISKYVQ